MPLLDFLRLNARWLLAGMLLTLLSSFGQTYFISIFAGHVMEDFQLSHGQWGGIYTIGTTASALVMVWAGGLTDRFRARTLGAGVLVLLAAACLFMAENPAWYILPLAVFCLRLTGQGMMSQIASVAVSRWFVGARGRALSISSLGFSLGEAILPLTFVFLMTLTGWRNLWLLAALIALAAIPVLLGLLRQERTPQSFAAGEQSMGMETRHWTRNQALRHWLFWFMIPALLGPAAFNTAFFFHQVHYAEVKGWTHLELVSLFPFYTLTAIAAMLASGWALDRFGVERVMPWYQIPLGLAFVVFAVTPSPGWAMVGLFLMGLTNGGMATMPATFFATFYGTGHLGSIKALSTAIMVFGSAVGPGLTGALIDLGLALPSQYFGVALYFVMATVLMQIGIRRARPLLAAG
ncbi:MFS transporter [Mesobacterium pallidum]|uniref:MFS transporter n=1 Tax=Mesobacterium pallidum TaxID=2872037 RepID=UPI001EE1C53B|nr:MFS transporter [Mesobacterium pallidum]